MAGEHSFDDAAFARLEGLTAERFAELVGQRVHLGAGRTLTVRAVTHPDEGDRPFDVELVSPERLVLGQAMHGVELPGVGLVPLFLVPGPVDDDGTSYVATFA